MADFRKRGRNWYFRFTDANGQRTERRGCPDRRMTEQMAREAESKAAQERAGMIDPKAEAYRLHESKPLADHLSDFQTHLTAKGNTSKHAVLFSERARRVATVAKVDRLSDLTPARIQAALSSLRDEGKSLATCNHHRAAIRGFSRWAWKDGRLRDDPLVGVAGFNAKEDRRHDRRTLSIEELSRLIRAAHEGPTYRKMTGPARALCYRLAVATGLRFSEIKSITPRSFVLGSEAPMVTVAPGYTKNGQTATLPLPHDLADDLAPYLATIAPEAPAFPLPGRGADMLKVDLQAAEIAYRDDAGRVFDFHSLRCQLATLADQAGVSPRVVQRLMRHSTLELTGRYTRPRAVDLEQAARSLPTFRPKAPTSESEAARATGTDGGVGGNLAPYLPLTGDGSSRPESDTVAISDMSDALAIGRKGKPETGLVASGRVVSDAVVNSGGGTRTPDTRIMIPLL